MKPHDPARYEQDASNGALTHEALNTATQNPVVPGAPGAPGARTIRSGDDSQLVTEVTERIAPALSLRCPAQVPCSQKMQELLRVIRLNHVGAE